MTQRDLPLLVIVHGPPGSGKTTIAEAVARELGFPLFAKDKIKRRALRVARRRRSGRVAPTRRRRLSDPLPDRASRARGRTLARARGQLRGRRGRARTLPSSLHRLVQVYCTAPENDLMERYLARDRHPGHHDRLRPEEVRAAVRSGRHDALALDGGLIELDTTRPVDTADLAARILRK